MRQMLDDPESLGLPPGRRLYSVKQIHAIHTLDDFTSGIDFIDKRVEQRWVHILRNMKMCRTKQMRTDAEGRASFWDVDRRSRSWSTPEAQAHLRDHPLRAF